MDKKKSDSSTNDFLNLLKEAGFRSIDQLIGNAEKEIAEKEFVDRTTLYKLQRGNKNPQIKTLKFLAEALSLGPNKKRFSVDDIIDRLKIDSRTVKQIEPEISMKELFKSLRSDEFAIPIDPASLIPPSPTHEHFIGRETDLSDLKEVIGIDSKKQENTSVRVLTAVRGWPGVGKTTMATVLARDPDISAAFPHGILWIDFRNKENILAKIRTASRALGEGSLPDAFTVSDAITKLRETLYEKCLLIVLDDVWTEEDYVPFRQALGPQCSMLITTRLPEIAYKMAPEEAIYSVPVLTDEKALELLRLLAPVISDYEEDALELVKFLECLPLSIHVAGGLINQEARMEWGIKELLQELKEGTILLKEKAPNDLEYFGTDKIPTISALLRKSTDLMPEEMRNYFASLGGLAPKPASFDLNLLRTFWEVEDPKPIIRILVNFGLMEPIGQSRFQMHGLLVMHARSLCASE